MFGNLLEALALVKVTGLEALVEMAWVPAELALEVMAWVLVEMARVVMAWEAMDLGVKDLEQAPRRPHMRSSYLLCTCCRPQSHKPCRRMLSSWQDGNRESEHRMDSSDRYQRVPYAKHPQLVPISLDGQGKLQKPHEDDLRGPQFLS
jgi:hypothetical protein